jgi:hypothetical protein
VKSSGTGVNPYRPSGRLFHFGFLGVKHLNQTLDFFPKLSIIENVRGREKNFQGNEKKFLTNSKNSDIIYNVKRKENLTNQKGNLL